MAFFLPRVSPPEGRSRAQPSLYFHRCTLILLDEDLITGIGEFQSGIEGRVVERRRMEDVFDLGIAASSAGGLGMATELHWLGSSIAAS